MTDYRDHLRDSRAELGSTQPFLDRQRDTSEEIPIVWEEVHPRLILEATDEELWRRSFKDFARRAWAEVEGRPVIWSWHMDAICDHLQAVSEGRIHRLIINIPPRMSKSTLVSVLWPAWEWLAKPHLRYLCSSAVDSVVMRDALRLHDLVDSDWYQHTFRPDWRWSKSQDAKLYYTNTRGGARTSRTVGSRLQGVDAERLIVDDPLDTRDATPSKVNLVEHVTWFDDRAMDRLVPEENAVVLIMQRLHDADLSGHLIERGGYDLLVLPAIMEAAKDGTPLQRSTTTMGFADPRQPGELLCSRFTRASLAEKRLPSERQFSAKYQQRPAPAEGAVFQLSWFHYWTEDTHPTEFDYKVSSWDTPHHKGRSNDWNVGQVWGVKGANCYLLEQTRKRIGFEEMVPEILAQHSRHPGMRATLIEEYGAGKAAVAALKATIPGIIGINHQGSTKEQRADAIVARWAAGQVYVPHPHIHPWVEKLFKPEVLGFPVARHDDQVDAMTQALIYIGEQVVTLPTFHALKAPTRPHVRRRRGRR